MGNNCSCTDAADKDQEIRTDAVSFIPAHNLYIEITEGDH